MNTENSTTATAYDAALRLQEAVSELVNKLAAGDQKIEYLLGTLQECADIVDRGIGNPQGCTTVPTVEKPHRALQGGIEHLVTRLSRMAKAAELVSPAAGTTAYFVEAVGGRVRVTLRNTQTDGMVYSMSVAMAAAFLKDFASELAKAQVEQSEWKKPVKRDTPTGKPYLKVFETGDRADIPPGSIFHVTGGHTVIRAPDGTEVLRTSDIGCLERWVVDVTDETPDRAEESDGRVSRWEHDPIWAENRDPISAEPQILDHRIKSLRRGLLELEAKVKRMAGD